MSMALPAAAHEPLRATTPLFVELDRALASGSEPDVEELWNATAGGRRDLALALLAIHDLHLAPVHALGRRASFQHHPAIASLKQRLEATFLARLADGSRPPTGTALDEMRKVAANDLTPPLYTWLAEAASAEELCAYLSLEGGPDGGFDDLVALCQVGIDGEAKLELATNYWDEMGRGSAAAVHTELHRRMARALGLRDIARTSQPTEALERSLLGSTLATNRTLQPELIGALGLLELQAGPRCRRVVQGLKRLAAGEDALAFYEEHAVADPRHGKDWLDHVVAPVATDFPDWAARIVQGARWRSTVNARFFAAAPAWLGLDPAIVQNVDMKEGRGRPARIQQTA